MCENLEYCRFVKGMLNNFVKLEILSVLLAKLAANRLSKEIISVMANNRFQTSQKQDL